MKIAALLVALTLMSGCVTTHKTPEVFTPGNNNTTIYKSPGASATPAK